MEAFIIEASSVLLLLQVLHCCLFYIAKHYCKVNTRSVMCVTSVISVGFLVKIYHSLVRMYIALSVVSVMIVVNVSMWSA